MSTPIKPQSPQSFAAMWVKKFAEIVTEAAGKDGRLSVHEAQRIAQRTDAFRLFGDNATEFFDATGQKSVTATKLIAVEQARALAAAVKAAGPDGRLSAADGKSMPAEFRDDFIYLRSGAQDALPTKSDLLAGAKDMALNALLNGSADRLPTAPSDVRGLKPLITNLQDEASDTRLSIWVTPSNDVYVSRASDKPSDLVGWYSVGRYGGEAQWHGQLRADIEHASDGLLLGSESDAPFKYVFGGFIDTEPVDEDMVRARLTQAHDALEPNIHGYHNDYFVKLADRTLDSVQDAAPYFQRLIDNADPNDPDSLARAKKYGELYAALSKNLTDLKVFRFGSIDISVVIVGRTRGGEIAGVMSGVIET